MAQEWLGQYVAAHVEAVQRLDLHSVQPVLEVLSAARQAGRKIFICGNGGSASIASHLSADLGKGASLGRDKRFQVVSLNENVAWMTALANDTGYENVFAEQMANLAAPGDVLIALSVSGNSPNIVKAVELANAGGLITIGLCGATGGKLSQLARHVIRVASDHFGHCEDAFMFLCHLIAYAFVENAAP